MGGEKGKSVTGQITRRDVLERTGALLGGVSGAGGQLIAGASADSEIGGWVTKGSRAEIGGQSVEIEGIEDPGTTMCNTGELYRCRTCTGVECYLLVGFGTPQPSVGSTYRFVPTDEGNWCGNFQVELQLGVPCEDSSFPTTDEGTESASEASAPTTTETTEAPTETTTETTTESTETTTGTTEAPTETTTEPAETTTETTEPTTETTETTADTTAETTPETNTDDED